MSISARTRQSTWSTDAPEASGARNLGICLIGGLPHCFAGKGSFGTAAGASADRYREAPVTARAFRCAFRPPLLPSGDGVGVVGASRNAPAISVGSRSRASVGSMG
jgi:hypothetical protein